ncbi:hypothetical protein [Roseivirga sp. UBA1976]|uniref:hypothetical protein n=1 Tax=Roseivirga sp. UBA1976 TaxID=1947386 RepID=UPI00257A5FF7|nr:hypothetical protein [Roseivirga sp. UBA1976]|tara:strand:- start:991 stop:1914 length:924 start_codon:yes stop_codon:yes gene_type:complete
MATFVNGEYLNDRLAPQILRELKDDKDDFLQAIPDAPEEAITEEGLRLLLIKETVTGDINPGADYDDNDVNELDSDKAIIGWDSLSTKPTKVTKDAIRASVYDKRNEIRVQHTRVLRRLYRDLIIHSLAPADDTDAKLPVLRTTGELVGGRRRLTIEDIINYQDALRALNVEEEGWNIRLSRVHLTDLLLKTKDNQEFRDLYHDRKTGEIMNLYNFNFWWGNHQLYYSNAGVKKARGAAVVAGDQIASLFWQEEYVCKAMGMVMAHLDPMSQNTRSNPPKEEFRLTAYAKAMLKHEQGTGALVSNFE